MKFVWVIFLSELLHHLNFLLLLLHIFVFLNTLSWVLGAKSIYYVKQYLPIWVISSEQRCDFNHYKISPTGTHIKGIAVTVASRSLSSFSKLDSVIMDMLCHWNITGNYIQICSFFFSALFPLYVFFLLYLNCLPLPLAESQLSQINYDKGKILFPLTSSQYLFCSSHVSWHSLQSSVHWYESWSPAGDWDLPDNPLSFSEHENAMQTVKGRLIQNFCLHVL